jgi:hypothetical protein
MSPLMIMSFHWFESWRCAAELSKRSLEEMRRSRNRMFQDLSFCMESYMRSPAFLELMRYNMVAMSQSRRGLASDVPAAPGALKEEAQERTAGVPAESAPVMTHPNRRSDADVSSPSVPAMGRPAATSAGGASAALAMIADPKDAAAGANTATSAISSQEERR